MESGETVQAGSETGGRDAPPVEFDWPVYADATLAGLSILIPIPLLDWAFEQFFRRRMAPSIAGRRGEQLSPGILAELRRGERGCVRGCLLFPLWAVVEVLKRLSRKILYFLTIKDAVDQLSYYWQRAFLIDYMLRAGHLRNETTAAMARQAMEQALQAAPDSLRALAGQVIASSRHILLSLWRARRGKQDAHLQRTEARMRQSWGDLGGYFQALADRYQQKYQQLSSVQSEYGQPGTI